MHYLDYITTGIALALAVSLIAVYAFGSLPLPPWGASGATKAAISGEVADEGWGETHRCELCEVARATEGAPALAL